MKAIIQRVNQASVTVDNKVVGSIEKGFLVLLGVFSKDTRTEAELLAKKTAQLRVFCDQNDKMNLSALDIDGEILAVSNFTLCADVKKGNRPSFVNAMPPQTANELYEYYCECLKDIGICKVEKGVFGADMTVNMEGNGPVTITLDTEIWSK